MTAKRSTRPNICSACRIDISNATDYFRRLKVCRECHGKDYVLFRGDKQRFCAKCGRFEPLHKFEGLKRSCTKKLLIHNKLRKIRYAQSKRNVQARNELNERLRTKHILNSLCLQKQPINFSNNADKNISSTKSIPNDGQEKTAQIKKQNIQDENYNIVIQKVDQVVQYFTGQKFCKVCSDANEAAIFTQQIIKNMWQDKITVTQVHAIVAMFEIVKLLNRT
eukprot:TRINITY_DN7539_c1_g1_i1.p1 TRINITY_DN7539_c1_g1~~TRINITY_DN7539_c1_g1_i1.p1  ORF type:complete len:255 (-),score=-1.93 TRINITY_DN7539_c1_g1_i1:191-856(-)